MNSQPTPFRPHPALRGPHAQTLAGILWHAARATYQARQHHVRLDDGDALVVHEDAPETEARRGVLLVHGLAGCHGSPYMRRLAQKLPRMGYHVFRLDLRGCGAGQSLAQKTFHAGCSPDVAQAVRYVHRHLYPQMPLTLVGFSLGGNIVLKLLGELGTQPADGVDSAIAVAPPVDLAACSRQLGRGAAVWYERFFVRWLWRHLHVRAQWMPQLREMDVRSRPRTLRQFDDQFTARLNGFDGVDDYYLRCSSSPWLSKIRLPTRILASADDPLVPTNVLCHAPRSPAVQLCIAQRGGHLGFIGATNRDPDRHWMDWRIAEWLDEFGS